MRPRCAITIVLVLLVAFTTLVHAKVSTDSVCQVRHGVHRGGGIVYSKGSGAYLGDRLVLTAAHVIRGAPRDAQFTVTFANGNERTGSAKHQDPKWDLALLELQRDPNGVPPMILATANAQRGQQVVTVGYDGGNTPIPRQGHVLQYMASSAQDAVADWYEIAGSVRGGSSGGPVCTPDGQLIGVIWGADGQRTTAVQLGRTKRFLLPWNARLEAVRVKAATGCWPPTSCAPPRMPSRGGGGRATYPSPRQPTPPPARPPAPAPKPSPSPPTKAPEPDDDEPDAPPSDFELEIDYGRLSELIIAKMEENPDAFRGPPGKDGDDGEDGKDGVNGADARSLAIVRVGPDGDEQTYRPDEDGMVRLPAPPGIGDLTIIQEGYHGESLTITPSPDGTLRLPPVMLQIEHPDGSVFQQAKPLGTPIRVKLVPVD